MLSPATGSTVITLLSLAVLIAGYLALAGLWWVVFRPRRGDGRGEEE